MVRFKMFPKSYGVTGFLIGRNISKYVISFKILTVCQCELGTNFTEISTLMDSSSLVCDTKLSWPFNKSVRVLILISSYYDNQTELCSYPVALWAGNAARASNRLFRPLPLPVLNVTFQDSSLSGNINLYSFVVMMNLENFARKTVNVFK